MIISVTEIAMRIAIEIFFTLFFVVVNTSKCPEIRKPHVTSCVIFYNCINLPEGGYVWVPAKCADGLVFQPSLRLCVLPGEIWTCDHQLNISPITHQIFHTSEFIDDTKTNYDELMEDSSKYSVNIFDKIDSSSNLDNFIKTPPYSLIKIDEGFNKNERHKIYLDSSQNSIKQSKHNLIRVNNGQEYMPVAMIKIRDRENDKILNLKSFIDNIFLYQHIAPSLKQQTFVSSPYVNHSILTNSKYIENNNILRNLIENYIFNREFEDLKPMKDNELMMEMRTTTEKIMNIPIQSNFISMTEKKLFDLEKIDQLNNILAVIGNLGNKEYVTFEKYKSWSNEMNIKILEVIPCTRGHRLPNSTDCTRYYTCDPTYAEIHEFICPANTAFNNQINLCDRKKYKSCRINRKSLQSETFSTVKLCETTGKFPDITSDKFYYLCYSSNSSGKIESFRMACPNNLIFCQDRKICTVKRLCTNFN